MGLFLARCATANRVFAYIGPPLDPAAEKYIFPLYTYEGRGLGPVEDHPSLRTLGMSPHTHTHTHTQHWVSPEARRALLELFAFQLVGWLVIGFLLQLRQWNPTHWLARRGPAEPDLLLSQGL